MQQRARSIGTAPSLLGPILIVTAIVTILGVLALRDTEIGVDLAATIPGIGQALGETLPAAVLMLVAAAANLAAGAIAVRALNGRPFDGPGGALLAGLGGAVFIDTAAMLGLGSIGAFTRAALFVLIGGILVAGVVVLRRGRLRPFVEPGGAREAATTAGERARDPSWDRFATAAFWLLAAIVWGAFVVLQLGSPVVPFGDVLPNHVAPVEHLRTFGSFATLTTSPSPIYGPSRIFLGYVATLGTLTTLTGLHATLAASGFILPLAIIVAVGAQRVAAGLFGPAAARWALLAFPVAFTFAQVPDARATVLVFPLAAFALERLLAGPPRAGEGPPSRTPALLPGGALAGAILVHPLLGVLTWLAAALLVGAAPARRRWAVPGLVAAAVVALAQALTAAGLGLASWIGLAPLGLGLFVLLRWRSLAPPPSRPSRAAFVPRARWPQRPASARPATVAALAVGLILAAPLVLSPATVADSGLEPGFGLLGLGTIGAALLAPRAAGWPIVVGALLVSLLAIVGVNLLPAESLVEQALRFEVPKTLRYWLPWFLASASAGALAATWDRSGRRPGLRSIVVATALVAAALPFDRGPLTIIAVQDRRFAESVSIQLRRATSGYFVNYPNRRTLIDADQQGIVDTLRSEESAGRLAADTTVLHVAASFQQWASTPIGVFSGALETTVSKDAEVSLHTLGGRLFGLAALPQLLGDGFTYVVLEPAGLSSDARDAIVAAGYQPIFANDRGEVFVRG